MVKPSSSFFAPKISWSFFSAGILIWFMGNDKKNNLENIWRISCYVKMFFFKFTILRNVIEAVRTFVLDVLSKTLFNLVIPISRFGTFSNIVAHCLIIVKFTYKIRTINKTGNSSTKNFCPNCSGLSLNLIIISSNNCLA